MNICRNDSVERISVLLVVQPHIFYTLCLLCVMQDYFYSGRKFRGFFNYLHKKLFAKVTNESDRDEVSDVSTIVADDMKENGDLQNDRVPVVSLPVCCAIFSVILIGVIAVEGCLIYLGAFVERVYFAVVLALMSSVLTLIGFVPQYLEVIRLQSTAGLSLTFLLLDCCGAVAGCVSLLVAGTETVDWFAVAIYLSVFFGDFALVVFKVLIFPNATQNA